MSFLEAAASGILPPEYSALITGPVAALALPFDPALATVVTTGNATFNVPIVKKDAGAAWVVEGGEITPDDPTMDELTITPSKVAGLTIISRELADDSSTDAQKMVGDGLARSIVTQINTAWLGSAPAPAQKGLGSLGVNTTAVTGTLANLDVFAEAISAAEIAGFNLTAFVVHPSDALAIAKLKDTGSSNKALLDNPRQILGRPLFVSDKATAKTIWGLDAVQTLTVLREDVQLAVSNEAYFSSDRVAIRASLRVGFGFPQPKAAVKITITA
ncbi:phage major capsid protein [Arthrobacter sp. A5]|uniref:phage major capsid protein n=1 Tax=Arthrobacter sp. A5 TaxID=576926 RepID=UPI003DA8E83B